MKRILIVDDSSTFRAIARMELAKGDFEILEALDGESALEILEEEVVDLVTMDLEMPGINGFETVRRLREKQAETSPENVGNPPVIFITSDDSMEVRRQGFDVGGADYITKPFVSGELLNSIHRILYPENLFKGLKLLVVDDSPTIRSMLLNILKGEGITAIPANNGKEALRIFQEQEVKFDMVLTDLVMPEMDGLQLCKALRHDLNQKDLPIFLLSGSANKDDVLRLYHAGITDYLSKPFAREELIARIRVHINSLLLNRELVQKVEQLKKLSKLKDEFLSIASHDLRNPLGNIKLSAELIAEGQVSEEETEEYLEVIQSTSQYLLELINDLLDLGHLQDERELDKSIFAFSSLVKESIQSLAQLAVNKNIQIEYQETSLQINGNAAALRRVITNLLSNAIKFTPEGGEIRLILEAPDDTNMQLTVQDNGIGIPANKIPVLFDKFTSASQAGTRGEKSAGLGMYIVKQLVEKHSGTITVESEPGKGTRFQIILPTIQ
ncbi:MAG: response regulator [Candidatus Nitrohelix vancouverensis]|uniref:histidine kinase n=1 Tax=Candidatus Nitrohelix vancouverensis TaxID=2705534 RepID=A0A7T0G302_9BACT|nr:MAG: response regulator [Candidatus Nitrohelix vancouverensis]